MFFLLGQRELTLPFQQPTPSPNETKQDNKTATKQQQTEQTKHLTLCQSFYRKKGACIYKSLFLSLDIWLQKCLVISLAKTDPHPRVDSFGLKSSNPSINKSY